MSAHVESFLIQLDWPLSRKKNKRDFCTTIGYRCFSFSPFFFSNHRRSYVRSAFLSFLSFPSFSFFFFFFLNFVFSISFHSRNHDVESYLNRIRPVYSFPLNTFLLTRLFIIALTDNRFYGFVCCLSQKNVARVITFCILCVFNVIPFVTGN